MTGKATRAAILEFIKAISTDLGEARVKASMNQNLENALKAIAQAEHGLDYLADIVSGEGVNKKEHIE